ncbi:hypothetical protein RJT34_03914 [Clitoria ternatea]|uniref:Uncharacterized protein n=1 Tax=Clitoria ternatea TaxID=43366 RepID=A0AAN9KMH9_CLITE
MLILEVAYCSFNAFDTVEAFTFLWSHHDRPSVTTVEGTTEEFIPKPTACRAGQRHAKGKRLIAVPEPSPGGMHGSLALHGTGVYSPPPSNITLPRSPYEFELRPPGATRSRGKTPTQLFITS